jgi:hypothetical protein
VKRLCSLIALAALAACGRSAQVEEKQQRWALERRNLEERLDNLEDRLITDQARVRFWEEMRKRHQNVSAIAVANLTQHARGMALYQEQQQAKRDALARKRRVAVRFVQGAERVP